MPCCGSTSTPVTATLEAAEESIAYENTRYSPEHCTWVDYAELGEPRYLSQWCRGAPASVSRDWRV